MQEISNFTNERIFENQEMRDMFYEWSKLNNSSRPIFISRNEWEKRDSILDTSSEGTKIIYIPEDVKLWEIVGILEVTESKRTEELKSYGKKLKKIGIYLAQRIEGVEEGKEIAEALAEEFYNYGYALETGKRNETNIPISEFSKEELTREDLTEIDKLLISNKFYRQLTNKVDILVDENPISREEAFEKIRKETIKRFFRALKKAEELEDKSATDERIKIEVKPWESETSFHSKFRQKITEAVKSKVEKPKSELIKFFLDNGIDYLKNNMAFDTLPDHIKQELNSSWKEIEEANNKLRNFLQISELKKELDEIKKTEDLDLIAAKEEEIVDKIQKAISSYKYETGNSYPSTIVRSQMRNCVGASLLGISFLEEIGIKTLIGFENKKSFSTGTDHSLIGFVNCKNEVSIRDFQTGSISKTLPRKYPDILNSVFSNQVNGQFSDLRFLDSDEGILIQLLGNMASYFNDINEPNISLVILENAATISKTPALLEYLVVQLKTVGKTKEAEELYKNLIKGDPRNQGYYFSLGNLYLQQNKDEEAAKIFLKTLEINPDILLINNKFISLKNLQKLIEYLELKQVNQDLINSLKYYFEKYSRKEL